MLKQACIFCKIVGAIAIIGALNWGLIGVANFNLIDHIFGVGSVASHIVYSLIGLSGLALLTSFFMVCPTCCNKDKLVCPNCHKDKCMCCPNCDKDKDIDKDIDKPNVL